jgi:hypothetical protein
LDAGELRILLRQIGDRDPGQEPQNAFVDLA